MKNKKNKLIGSAASLEQLEKLASQYFYSTCKITQVGPVLKVYNLKGMICGYTVKEKNGRFRLELELTTEGE